MVYHRPCSNLMIFRHTQCCPPQMPRLRKDKENEPPRKGSTKGKARGVLGSIDGENPKLSPARTGLAPGQGQFIQDVQELWQPGEDGIHKGFTSCSGTDVSPLIHCWFQNAKRRPSSMVSWVRSHRFPSSVGFKVCRATCYVIAMNLHNVIAETSERGVH